MTTARSAACCVLTALVLCACPFGPTGPQGPEPVVVAESTLAGAARTLPLGTYVVGTLEPTSAQPAAGTDLESAGIDRYTFTLPEPATVTLILQDDGGEPHTASLFDATGQLLAQAAHGSAGMPQALKKGDYVLEIRFMGSGTAAKGYYVLPTAGDDGMALQVVTMQEPVTAANLAAITARVVDCVTESQTAGRSLVDCLKGGG